MDKCELNLGFLAQIKVKSFLTVATIFCKIKKATIGSSFFSLQKKEKTKKLETDSWTRAKRTDEVNCFLIQGKWRTQSKCRYDNFEVFCGSKINHIEVALHCSIRRRKQATRIVFMEFARF